MNVADLLNSLHLYCHTLFNIDSLAIPLHNNTHCISKPLLYTYKAVDYFQHNKNNFKYQKTTHTEIILTLTQNNKI
jgi:hypothetical protein